MCPCSAALLYHLKASEWSSSTPLPNRYARPRMICALASPRSAAECRSAMDGEMSVDGVGCAAERAPGLGGLPSGRTLAEMWAESPAKYEEGIARLRFWPSLSVATATPMTFPVLSRMGRPLLPGEIGAVV